MPPVTTSESVISSIMTGFWNVILCNGIPLRKNSRKGNWLNSAFSKLFFSLVFLAGFLMPVSTVTLTPHTLLANCWIYLCCLLYYSSGSWHGKRWLCNVWRPLWKEKIERKAASYWELKWLLFQHAHWSARFTHLVGLRNVGWQVSFIQQFDVYFRELPSFSFYLQKVLGDSLRDWIFSFVCNKP